MPVSARQFRDALRHFPAGVTVVTTRDARGHPRGLTVSAFTAVSLCPPLVLVCVDRTASAYPAFEGCGWFAVNLLGKSQEHLARRFAASIADRFVGVAFRDGHAGVPLLDDAVAALQCRLAHRYPGGDHSIFVGQVEATGGSGGPPLLYFRGGYQHLNVDGAG